MHQIIALRNALRPHLDWHSARVTFLALFLIAVYRVKTVNLAQIATAFPGRAKAESNYKRLQRFFRAFELDYDTMARLVVKVMDIPEPWVLSVDRTTWEIGNCTINILMLGVVHQGVAFPLFWTFRDKRGNSNTEERSSLLTEFLVVFERVEVAYLTADREFIGKDWIGFLNAQPRQRFRIRIRESERLKNSAKTLPAAVVFAHLQPQQVEVLKQRRRLWGHWLFIAGLRLEDGSLLIVATSDSPQTAISDYAARWGIETLFGIFKTRGFCLESTHLKDDERLSKLIALLTLALCWAHRIGEWRIEQSPIPIKKHGRKAKSIFRVGFDHLRQILLNLDSYKAEYLDVLQFLSCT